MSILIIDYGGLTVGNISTILTKLNTNSITIKPDDEFPQDFTIKGIVLSGGPDHVYQEGSRKLPVWIDQFEGPILGICYGLHLLVDYLKGKVGPLPEKEYGFISIKSIKDDPLLGEFDTKIVWMNHYDAVIDVPKTLEVTSISENNGCIVSLNDGKKWWGVQHHPENDLECQRECFLLERFLNICK
jgi:GMP synthase (glutamine-hydrolysing)